MRWLMPTTLLLGLVCVGPALADPAVDRAEAAARAFLVEATKYADQADHASEVEEKAKLYRRSLERLNDLVTQARVTKLALKLVSGAQVGRISIPLIQTKAELAETQMALAKAQATLNAYEVRNESIRDLVLSALDDSGVFSAEDKEVRDVLIDLLVRRYQNEEWARKYEKMIKNSPDKTAGQPFELRDVKQSTYVEYGKTVVVVTGKIVNISSRRLATPRLVARVYNKDDKVLDEWQFSPVRAELAPGEETEFSDRFTDPPKGAVNLVVSLAPEG